MTELNDSLIREALAKVVDPAVGTDIVSAGYVRDIIAGNGRITCELVLPSPLHPGQTLLRRGAEDALLSVSEKHDPGVRITYPEPKPRGPAESGLAGVQTIIAVSSCKGGVGKSTVAAGLAREYVNRGLKVGLLDTDVYGPSVPTLFDMQHVQGVSGTEDKMMIPLAVNGLKVMSFGFLLGKDPAVLRGPIVSNYISQLLSKTLWGELDVLILDMPPGTGDIQLTITQGIQLDGAVIVTTPHSLALADVERGILMFDKVNVPVLGVVENMAYFECGKCSEKHMIFGDSTRGLVERYGLDVITQLPLQPDVYGGGFKTYTPNAAMSDGADAVGIAMSKVIREGVARPQVSHDSIEITVTYADETSTVVNNYALRTSCPCAVCVNELTGEKVLNDADIRPDIAPKQIKAVGNYALQVVWNDGHDSGLFSWDFIRAVADRPI